MVHRAFWFLVCWGSAWVAQGQELDLVKWSGELNVPDPVAVTVDPQGRVYVAATTRRKVADLDIREHQMWIPDDVGLDSVEAKRAFYHRELAPGKLRVPRGSLKDHNKDGSIDWKDLTVHSERIYQLRDEDGDGVADKMTVFAEGFNTEVTGIAAGVLYHDGWVYATIAPDLWRLKDTNDDGVADVREVVAHGFGMHIAYAGHDMHGPRLGVDGRIYWSIGDKGVNVTSREGKHFYFPHEGAVLRVEPDGTGFEVFAHGLRNVQEVAFDAWGNVFGVDNDADMTGEKERVVHIVEGSDSGWRCGHQYMKAESRWMREGIWQTAHPGQPLFITPPIALSRNGPAGFLWEPGTALGESLRGKFLLNQFPSGEMSALTLEAKGASFVQSAEVMVNRGIMGIGMAWGPEGAFYMADWEGGYPLDEKGAIWRVDAKSGRDDKARAEVLALLKGEFKKQTVDELAALLGHADQRVRVGAQLELVKRGQWERLAGVALDGVEAELARCHAVWGLGMGMRRGLCGGEVCVQLVADGSARVREQVAKVLGDAPGTKGEVLIPRLGDESAPVRVQAAIAVGKLKVTSAKAALVAMAERDGADPVLRHAVAMGLAGSVDAGELAALAKAESMWVRAAGLLALRERRAPEVAVFLADAEERLVDEAARAIHDDAGVPMAWPKLAALMEETRAFSEMTWRRVLNAAFRVGGAENAIRVLGFALDETKPVELRLAAFQHLTEWVEPPKLDRVDGMVQDLSRRDASGADEAALERVSELLALGDAELKSVAILMLVALKVPVAAEAMVTMIGDKSAPSEVRAEALKLMAAQHGDKSALDEALKRAWEDKAPAELKRVALEVTAARRPGEYAGLLKKVLGEGKELALKQAALAFAATVEDGAKAATGAVVSEWMAALAKGKVPAELMLDVLEAATALAAAVPELQTAVAGYEAARPAPTMGVNGMPVMPLPKELLKGGSRERGKDVVTNHLGGNCLACHVVEAAEGSNVGPALTGIGKLKPREYLLESLLQPGAVIAPGFGMVSVTKKDGVAVAGTVMEDTAEALKVRATDGALVAIQKNEIASQTPPISVMPPMLGILTRSEVRDVVAYLASLTKLPKKVEAKEH